MTRQRREGGQTLVVSSGLIQQSTSEGDGGGLTWEGMVLAGGGIESTTLAQKRIRVMMGNAIVSLLLHDQMAAHMGTER